VGTPVVSHGIVWTTVLYTFSRKVRPVASLQHVRIREDCRTGHLCKKRGGIRMGLDRPDDATRARMRLVRRSGTSAEMKVRSALHRRGLRYFVDRSPMRGIRSRADVIFPRRRLALYVDGCFWHSCPLHGTRPKKNAEWWAAKLDANVKRDRATDEQLSLQGWTVIRAWEHESPEDVVGRVLDALRRQ
jgi:DNA mismatch endonuclease (patch repair protein)